MPTARRVQTAAAFVVELGNGDKFIVDIGSASTRLKNEPGWKRG